MLPLHSSRLPSQLWPTTPCFSPIDIIHGMWALKNMATCQSAVILDLALIQRQHWRFYSMILILPTTTTLKYIVPSSFSALLCCTALCARSTPGCVQRMTADEHAGAAGATFIATPLIEASRCCCGTSKLVVAFAAYCSVPMHCSSTPVQARRTSHKTCLAPRQPYAHPKERRQVHDSNRTAKPRANLRSMSMVNSRFKCCLFCMVCAH